MTTAPKGAVFSCRYHCRNIIGAGNGACPTERLTMDFTEEELKVLRELIATAKDHDSKEGSQDPKAGEDKDVNSLPIVRT